MGCKRPFDEVVAAASAVELLTDVQVSVLRVVVPVADLRPSVGPYHGAGKVGYDEDVRLAADDLGNYDVEVFDFVIRYRLALRSSHEKEQKNEAEYIGMWSHFHHEADIGVRGTGSSCEQAFEQAAIALTGVITDPESVSCTETVTIQCEASDIELL